MGHKIFITYKYGDTSVYPLHGIPWYEQTKVRDYVSKLQEYLELDDHINKGELDGQDLSEFKDDTIASRLRDKIYDSSITLVFISKNMKDPYLAEEDQWIPWEVAYSLREATRNDRTSRTNAMLAVVIPDENNSYEYFLEYKSCCTSKCLNHKNETLFNILKNNMFNIKVPDYRYCKYADNGIVYFGLPSYIDDVKWVDFTSNIGLYLNKAILINENINDYNIVKVP